MNARKTMLLAGTILAAATLTIVGCEKKTPPPPAPKAGGSTGGAGGAVDQMKESADKAKEKINDAAKDAKEKVNEAAKDAKDKADEAVDQAKQQPADAKTAMADQFQKQYDGAKSSLDALKEKVKNLSDPIAKTKNSGVVALLEKQYDELGKLLGKYKDASPSDSTSLGTQFSDLLSKLTAGIKSAMDSIK